MATTPGDLKSIDANLEIVRLELNALAELGERWQEFPPLIRRNRSEDWGDAMDRLLSLREFYANDRMNAQQAESYRALIRDLQAAQSLIQQLDLDFPSVPLPEIP